MDIDSDDDDDDDATTISINIVAHEQAPMARTPRAKPTLATRQKEERGDEEEEEVCDHGFKR